MPERSEEPAGRVPRSGVRDALTWLRARGEPVRLGVRVASADEIAALGALLGRPLPPSYVTFVETHESIETRSFRIYGLESGAELGAVATSQKLRRSISGRLASFGTQGLHPDAAAVVHWVAVADLGDTLGSVLFVDTDGAFRWVAVRELLLDGPGPKLDVDFGELVLETLAETYDEPSDDFG